eukprot:gnl/TRDRNA2_/TRDRNA2_41526_c0_seq1.p1 gnl/TRDRNA2_/TRDRNA2_41526_c0~~gnl/TRDRNA2_/TRDRNA2_41526_c0_seq1.p1  ORF type:complete len:254 (-),score=30.47 gnl/TRDRNA2_/TRDRNA2_41526_c0_seq1:199-960(-)
MKRRRQEVVCKAKRTPTSDGASSVAKRSKIDGGDRANKKGGGTLLSASDVNTGLAFNGCIDKVGSCIRYEPHLAGSVPARANTWLEKLLKTVKWEQGQVRVFGKVYPEPRLTCYYGDKPYTYSGRTVHPRPWSENPVVSEIRRRVEAATGEVFNSVLCNRYRSGADTVGWHADNEKVYGPMPTIASVTLGEPRDFDLRENDGRQGRFRLKLGHGSLLVMSGNVQNRWQHSLPRRLTIKGERVNLTFRRIVQVM